MENRGGKSGEIRGNPGAGKGNKDRQGGPETCSANECKGQCSISMPIAV